MPAHSPVMPSKRSRNGCRECRRRHRRCDEVHPSCGYCVHAGKTCQYSRDLRWGGRPFIKSRFGKCLEPGHSTDETTSVQQVFSEDSRGEDGYHEFADTSRPFVYVSQDHTQRPTSESGGRDGFINRNQVRSVGRITATVDGEEQDEERKEEDDRFDLDDPSPVSEPILDQIDRIPPMPSVLLQLTRENRVLFDYFQHVLTRSVSCHEGMQAEICSALLPLVTQSRSTMAAVLCAAACHRLSVGLEQTESRALHLRSQALQHLNDSLRSPGTSDLVSAFGAIMALCLSDIASPTATNASWHVHLAGASSLLLKLSSLQTLVAGTQTGLLIRLYTSFKSIAASCSRRADAELFDAACFLSDEGGYIDDLAGFSTRLRRTIQAMHRIDELRQREAYAPSQSEAFLQTAGWTHQYAQLILEVETMLRARLPVFRAEVNDTLSEWSRRDFMKLDEAYHHMVLLQLYWRADPGQTHFGSLIQACAQRIIDNIAGMDIAARPCPAVATLPPLFEAGYWITSGQDQQRLIDTLKRVHACYGMGNVTCAIEYLQQRWARNHDNSTTNGADTELCTKPLGFLPY